MSLLLLSNVSCKYHKNVDDYISSQTPPTLYKSTQDRVAFVKEYLPNAKEIRILPDSQRKKSEFGLIPYPYQQQQNLVEGNVVFFIEIDKDGTTEIISEYSYNHNDFLINARKAVNRTRFKEAAKKKYYFISIEYSIRYPISTFVSYGKLDEVIFVQNN